jgi:hypothetical protein
MKNKRIKTNQPIQTQNKKMKMSDNVKLSVKHSQKQTRSLWAKRLGNLQAHKQTEKRMKKEKNQNLWRIYYHTHLTIFKFSHRLKEEPQTVTEKLIKIWEKTKNRVQKLVCYGRTLLQKGRQGIQGGWPLPKFIQICVHTSLW